LRLSVSGKDLCVTFTSGGRNRVTVSRGEERADVELETHKWDCQVEAFLGEV